MASQNISVNKRGSLVGVEHAEKYRSGIPGDGQTANQYPNAYQVIAVVPLCRTTTNLGRFLDAARFKGRLISDAAVAPQQQLTGLGRPQDVQDTWS
jgi:hypothetical protein